MNAPAGSRGDGSGRIGKQLSFLPEPEFSAQTPPPATLAAILLRRLLAGEALTHPDFEDTGSWRLGAHIYVLRELGWPVETEELSAPSPSCPTRTIARYRMPGWVNQVLRGKHVE